MSLTIQGEVQVARGLKANLPSVGAAGELFFCTDTNQLFVGTGTGMVVVGGGSQGLTAAQQIALMIVLG
jgi:hypothetical protein